MKNFIIKGMMICIFFAILSACTMTDPPRMPENLYDGSPSQFIKDNVESSEKSVSYLYEDKIGNKVYYYDSQNRVIGIENANSDDVKTVTKIFKYTENNLLDDVTITWLANDYYPANSALRFDYEYNASGLLTKINEVSIEPSSPEYVARYFEIEYENGLPITEKIYHRYGEALDYTYNGCLTYTYNENNLISSVKEYSIDDILLRTHTISYNADNQPVTIIDNSETDASFAFTSQLTYNDDGKLIKIEIISSDDTVVSAEHFENGVSFEQKTLDHRFFIKNVLANSLHYISLLIL